VDAYDDLLALDEPASDETSGDEAASEERGHLNRDALALGLTRAQRDGVRPRRGQFVDPVDHRAGHVPGHEELDGVDLPRNLEVRSDLHEQGGRVGATARRRHEKRQRERANHEPPDVAPHV